MSEATLEIPHSEKGKAGAAMGAVFKAAMSGKAAPVEAAPVVPAEKPAEKPLEKPAIAAPAEKPATEKPAAAATVPDVSAPPELKGKARERFENLEKEMRKWREAHDQIKPQFEMTQAELVKAKKDQERYAKMESELEDLKKKGSEYESIVKQFYIEHDPQFQSHFGQRLSAAVVEAKEAVGTEHAVKVAEILSYPPSPFRDKQLAEIADGLTDFQRTELVNAYSSLKRTERERKAELDKGPENFKKLQELQANKAREESAKASENRNALLAHVQKQIEPELAGVDAVLAETIKTTVRKAIEGDIDAEGYVGLLVDSAKGKKFAATMKDKDDTIAKLQAQIQELSSTQPTVQGGKAVDGKKDKSVSSAYQDALAGKLKAGWSQS